MSNTLLGRRELLKAAGIGAMMQLAPRGGEAGAAQGKDPARQRELYGLLGELLESVPAYVARPATVQGRLPAIVFNHSHGGGYTIGKLEFVDGRSYLQPVPMCPTS